VSGEYLTRTVAARRPTECPPDPTCTEIKRDLPDDTLLPLNADLDQNDDPEVAQRGNLNAR
jgi:hypothetical protein